MHFSVLEKETGPDILGSQEDKSFFSLDTKKCRSLFSRHQETKVYFLLRKFQSTIGAIFSVITDEEGSHQLQMSMGLDVLARQEHQVSIRLLTGF